MAADLLNLYRWAVQDPRTHAAVVAHMYESICGSTPRVLREDFAGSSADSVAWVAGHAFRRAVAIDHDAETLAWAERRAQRLLGANADRLKFIAADVTAVTMADVPPADIITALNFSVFQFHRRDALAGYFQHARRSLAPQGILVFNAFGGPGAMRPSIERRRVKPVADSANETPPPPFEYQWEQRRFDAVSGCLDCRIHFVLDETPDGPGPWLLNDAFCYNFRLWALPELMELLHECGYADVQVWRHTSQGDPSSPDIFLGKVDSIETDLWVVYVIARG